MLLVFDILKTNLWWLPSLILFAILHSWFFIILSVVGALMYIVVTSEYIDLCALDGKLLVEIENNNGPRALPCGFSLSTT